MIWVVKRAKEEHRSSIEWLNNYTDNNVAFNDYVNRIIKKQDGVVNKTFVEMLEALGYDNKLTYVKRKSDATGATF